MRQTARLFLIIFVSSITCGFLHAAIPAAERNALIALYNSTDGDNWTTNTNWKKPDGSFNDPGTENTWFQIYCDAGNSHVTDINLFGNNLVGSLPPELGDLVNIQYIYLYGNQLSGTIPPELGYLANLAGLYLHENQLSGAVPPQLGNLSNLQDLYLNQNQLSGSIPPELGNLTNLVRFNLHFNQLSGSIPPELGNLTNLADLDLWSNELSGSIPPELGNLIGLAGLYLHTNQLSGAIPPELGNLSNLMSMALSFNPLSGTIPPELGNLANLINLSIDVTQISGNIPPELGDLANLQSMSLSNNQLSGIPPELGNLANLTYLNLSENLLSGSIPPELGSLPALESLYLYGNQISGSIPPELGDMANLRTLHLYDNQLSGSIPPKLGNLTTLERLYLYDNQLSGSIPPELGNLANLECLYLYNNRLSGNIPPELGNLTALAALYLHGNQLSGSIPVELMDPSSLAYLRIRYNALYAGNAGLISFLDSLDAQWDQTQTIAPQNLQAEALSPESIRLSWDPIPYTADSGGYRVFFSQTSGGPSTLFDSTLDKISNQMDVTGLNPETDYYFCLQTWTDPHSNNNNLVSSENSEEVSAESFASSYLISGTVTADGSGLGGVVLNGLPGPPLTHADGSYSVPVDFGWSGTVTPAKTGYSFLPETRDYTDVQADAAGEDYSMTLLTTTISGTVESETGPLRGVVLNGLPGNPATAADGSYSAAVEYGWSGTVTPAKAGYSFQPASRTYSNVTADRIGENYATTGLTTTLSGSVESSGEPLPGVIMNGLPGSPQSGADGTYSAAVEYGWSGEVTPAKAGYSFIPAARTYSNVTADAAGQNYSATRMTFTLSGSVRFQGTPLEGVVMNGLPGSPQTGADGSYSAAVEYGWPGTITPAKNGFSFLPAARSYSDVTASALDQDFSAASTVSLLLRISREEERAWVVSREYGRVTITIENPAAFPIARFILFRKSGGGDYSVLQEFPGSDAPSQTLSHNDAYLENSVTYTYQAAAVDAEGKILVYSGEISI